jgi:hemerythrin
MVIATWDDKYNTGHKIVDIQHQELFQMVNDLHDAIASEQDKDSIIKALEKLSSHTLHHFATEETLMVKIGYPHLKVHKKKHEDLVKNANEIIEGYRTGRFVLTSAVSKLLSDWLRHHIQEDDKALVKYIQSHPE